MCGTSESNGVHRNHTYKKKCSGRDFFVNAPAGVNVSSTETVPCDAIQIEDANHTITIAEINNRQTISECTEVKLETQNSKGVDPESENTGFSETWAAFQSVYRTRTITEKEYLRLSYWMSGMSFGITTAWFVATYTACGILIENQSQKPYNFQPGDYNIALPILQYTTLGFTALLTIGLSGICLWNAEYPLVKTRGKRFVIGLAVSALMTLVGVLVGILGNFYRFSTTTGVFGWIRQIGFLVGGVSVVSLLASRQSFLYHLFLGSQFALRHLDAIWYLTYIFCVLPAFILSIVYTTMTLSSISTNFKMLFSASYFPSLTVLVYYAYKSQRIGSGFGHWGSCLRLAIFLTVVSVSLRIIVVYLLTRIPKGKPTDWTRLLSRFGHMYLVSIAINESLLSIAILALLDVQPLDCLDPRITYRSTFPTSTPMPIVQQAVQTRRILYTATPKSVGQSSRCTSREPRIDSPRGHRKNKHRRGSIGGIYVETVASDHLLSSQVPESSNNSKHNIPESLPESLSGSVMPH